MKFIGKVDEKFRAAVEAAHAEALPKLMDLNIAFVKNGHVHKMLDGLTIEICGRMRTAAGRAIVRKELGTGVIRLNYRLLGRNTAADIRATYLHELAHIVANLVHGRSVGHTLRWKRIAIALGDDGGRCHSLDVTGLKYKRNKQPRVTFKCPCSVYELTKARYLKYLGYKAATGRSIFSCRKCKQPLHAGTVSAPAAEEIAQAA